MQARTVMSSRSFRVSLTTSQHVASTLVKPIGITRNSQSPQRVRNAVFYSSPSTIRIEQNASRRSIFENQFAPISRFFDSLMLGSRYLFLIVKLLILQQLTTRRSSLFFLGTNSISNATGEVDFRIQPLLSILLIQQLSACSSFPNSAQIGLYRGFAPSSSVIL